MLNLKCMYKTDPRKWIIDASLFEGQDTPWSHPPFGVPLLVPLADTPVDVLLGAPDPPVYPLVPLTPCLPFGDPDHCLFHGAPDPTVYPWMPMTFLYTPGWPWPSCLPHSAPDPPRLPLGAPDPISTFWWPCPPVYHSVPLIPLSTPGCTPPLV